jgi:arylsulfatase A-like enzyme
MNLGRRDLLKFGLYGGLATSLSPYLWLSGCSKRQKAKMPNIIVLTIDTLRADHMGLYGHLRDTMPVIGKFAETAVVFDNAVVSRGLTRPSYASMLTGLYPFHHGVYNHDTVLHEGFARLPEILRSVGYHTAAFMSNFSLVKELSGCHHGFDLYDDYVKEREINRLNYERTAPNTVKAILEWLETEPTQPFFLFTNFIDPHAPYFPPPRLRHLYQSNKEWILNAKQIPRYARLPESLNYFDYVDGYDGEIRYTDEALGVLIDQLKRKGLWDDAIVIFTSDHGEHFGEHNILFRHHLHIWEAAVRVPLVVRLPRSRINKETTLHRRVSGVASPMDMMPTILDYIGIEPDGKMDGKSLLPILTGSKDSDRAIFLEFPDHGFPPNSPLVPPSYRDHDVYAVRSSTHKLIRIRQLSTGRVIQKVFEIATDPMEKQPLNYDDRLPLHRKLAEQMDSMLEQVRKYQLPFTLTYYKMLHPSKRPDFIEQRGSGPKKIIKQLSPEQVEALRSLGYIE